MKRVIALLLLSVLAAFGAEKKFSELATLTRATNASDNKVLIIVPLASGYTNYTVDIRGLGHAILNVPPITMTDDWVDANTNVLVRTLTANTTLHLTNFVLGSYVVLDVIQDSTGTRTLAFDSTNSLVYRNSTNQVVAVDVNTNATFRSQYTFYKANATTIVIGGPDTASDSREADLLAAVREFYMSGSAGAIARNNNAFHTNFTAVTTIIAPGLFGNNIIITNNLVFNAIKVEDAVVVTAQTNYGVDMSFAEHYFLMTNNIHVSSVENSITPDPSETTPKYTVLKCENLSGSAKVLSVASGMKRSGTNYVSVPNGAAAIAWFRSHGLNITNTLATITLFDSP